MKLERYSEAVRSLVAELAGSYLPGWRIKLEDELDDDTNLAEVGWSDHLFVATLWLSDELLGSNDQQFIAAVIVHEFMHVLMRDLRIDFMPDKEEDPEGWERWRHLEELLVERVSIAAENPTYPVVS